MWRFHAHAIRSIAERRNGPSQSADILQRRAIIYVRQSTGVQVQDNLESQRRARRSRPDLPLPGGRDDRRRPGTDRQRARARPGFEALVAQLCQGAVGAVFLPGGIASGAKRARLASHT
jgi:hypothetical protein